MAKRMATAAQLDSESRSLGKPALAKLALLPEVTALLNRSGAIQESIVDPENDLLRSIVFFLEPSQPDGSLPAYAIQKELFAVLPRLPIGVDELRGGSHLGQCVLFYTRSKRPEQGIKRLAERLLTKWMSLMLKRPNDYRNGAYDPAASQRYVTFAFHISLIPHPPHLNLSIPLTNQNSTQLPHRTSRQTIEEMARERALQDPTYANRARIQGGLATYTVAPVNKAIPGSGQGTGSMGARTDAQFRKIQARSQGGRR